MIHFNRINSNLLQIFNTLFENEEIAKLCLIIINKHFKNIHQTLKNKLDNDQIGY